MTVTTKEIFDYMRPNLTTDQVQALYRLMEKGADLMQALVDSELQPSRGQARKTIASNAITINGEKQADPEYTFVDSDRLYGRYTLLRRGKKNYCLVCWK